jgi:uncharacterized membrane protein
VIQNCHKPVFCVFLLCWFFNAGALFLTRKGFIPEAHAGLALAMTATTLVGLARRLPMQNVITAALAIAVMAAAFLAFGVHTGLPFGAFEFRSEAEPLIFGVPLLLPAYWVALAICARGCARLPLRPWRKTNHYGYWMIGLSLIILLFQITSAEPLLGHHAHYWNWRTRPGTFTWYGMPWSNWLGCAASFLVMYLLATPWLINKQPVKQPVDWHPLVVWTLLETYFAMANFLNGDQAATVAGVSSGVILLLCAIPGSRQP